MRLDGFNFIPGVILVKPDEVVLYPFSSNPLGRQCITFPSLDRQQIEGLVNRFVNENLSDWSQILILDRTLGFEPDEIFSISSSQPNQENTYCFIGATEMHADGVKSLKSLVVQVDLDDLVQNYRLSCIRNGRPVNPSEIPLSLSRKSMWVFGAGVDSTGCNNSRRMKVDSVTDGIVIEPGTVIASIRRPNVNVPHSVDRNSSSCGITRSTQAVLLN
jgi:hypothetical protein